MDDNRPAILLQESVADWRGSRGYVADVAAAITLAATDERAAGRTYNVGEREACREADWVKRLADVIGRGGRIVAVPDGVVPAHLHVPFDLGQHWWTDTSNIRAELGYIECVPQRDALQRTIAWELANPPEPLEAALLEYAAEDEDWPN